MADEHEIPVKVVDRRWWAREGGDGASAAAERTSLKPTYVEELEAKLAEKDKLVQEYLGKYRQAAQEFEDARARLRKELAKDAERNRREVLVSLLDVVDNLDRALDAADRTGTPGDDALRQGVELVRRQFLSKLEGFGIRRIDSLGLPFDPVQHEAVSAVPTSEAAQDGHVAGVVRAGYKIGDDILRPALVAVAKASEVSSRQ